MWLGIYLNYKYHAKKNQNLYVLGKDIYAKLVGDFRGVLRALLKIFQPLNIFAKRSILDVWHGFEYAFEFYSLCITYCLS